MMARGCRGKCVRHREAGQNSGSCSKAGKCVGSVPEVQESGRTHGGVQESRVEAPEAQKSGRNLEMCRSVESAKKG